MYFKIRKYLYLLISISSTIMIFLYQPIINIYLLILLSTTIIIVIDNATEKEKANTNKEITIRDKYYNNLAIGLTVFFIFAAILTYLLSLQIISIFIMFIIYIFSLIILGLIKGPLQEEKWHLVKRVLNILFIFLLLIVIFMILLSCYT